MESIRLRVVIAGREHDEVCTDLDQLVCEGARRMLAATLEAEVDVSMAAHAARVASRAAARLSSV